MFKLRRISSILKGLRAADAVMLVWWNGDGPRILLKDWCGHYKGSVSIGTAECVLDEINRGVIGRPPLNIQPWMRKTAIETVFVKEARKKWI